MREGQRTQEAISANQSCKDKTKKNQDEGISVGREKRMLSN